MEESTTQHTPKPEGRIDIAPPAPRADHKDLWTDTDPDAPKDQVYSDWASI